MGFCGIALLLDDAAAFETKHPVSFMVTDHFSSGRGLGDKSEYPLRPAHNWHDLLAISVQKHNYSISWIELWTAVYSQDIPVYLPALEPYDETILAIAPVDDIELVQGDKRGDFICLVIGGFNTADRP